MEIEGAEETVADRNREGEREKKARTRTRQGGFGYMDTGLCMGLREMEEN